MRGQCLERPPSGQVRLGIRDLPLDARRQPRHGALDGSRPVGRLHRDTPSLPEPGTHVTATVDAAQRVRGAGQSHCHAFDLRAETAEGEAQALRHTPPLTDGERETRRVRVHIDLQVSTDGMLPTPLHA